MQVSRIDVTRESPRGHGYVTCLSIYCGPDVHFGPPGATAVIQNQLWVDTLLEGRPEDEVRSRPAAASLDVDWPAVRSALSTRSGVAGSRH